MVWIARLRDRVGDQKARFHGPVVNVGTVRVLAVLRALKHFTGELAQLLVVQSHHPSLRLVSACVESLTSGSSRWSHASQSGP